MQITIKSINLRDALKSVFKHSFVYQQYKLNSICKL